MTDIVLDHKPTQDDFLKSSVILTINQKPLPKSEKINVVNYWVSVFSTDTIRRFTNKDTHELLKLEVIFHVDIDDIEIKSVFKQYSDLPFCSGMRIIGQEIEWWKQIQEKDKNKSVPFREFFLGKRNSLIQSLFKNRWIVFFIFYILLTLILKILLF